jgi:hypothetical protein
MTEDGEQELIVDKETADEMAQAAESGEAA